MTPEEMKLKIIESRPELKEGLASMQKEIDALKADPRYRQYVEQRKLRLIDDRFSFADALLTAGLLH